MRALFSAPLRHPFASLAVVLLAAGIGWGSCRIGRQVWAHQRYQAAETALIQQDFDRALAELELCLGVWPERIEVRFRAARAARRAGHLDKAEQHLAQCEKTRQTRLPAEVDLDFERACLRVQQGDLELSGYLSSKLRDKGGDAILAMEALAQGLALHQKQEAESLLESMLREDPRNLPGRVLRCQLFMKKQDHGGAVRECRATLEYLPRAFEPRLVLAKTLQSQGNPRAAAKEFQILAAIHPDRPDGLLGLGLCRAEMHQFDEAAKHLDEALARHPKHVQALVERGRVALHQGKSAEAEAFFQRAVAVNSKSADAYRGLIQALAKQDKKDEAAARQKQLDDLEFAQGILARDIIAISETGSKSMEQSLAIAARLMATGQEEEAEFWYLALLAVEPRQSEARQALADYYERSGEPHRAAWQRQQIAGKS